MRLEEGVGQSATISERDRLGLELLAVVVVAETFERIEKEDGCVARAAARLHTLASFLQREADSVAQHDRSHLMDAYLSDLLDRWEGLRQRAAIQPGPLQ